MFKPLPLETTGIITEAASRIATLLTVDTALFSKIAALGAGNWTYLHIVSAGKIEVVKVTGVSGLRIKVIRGQEGTDREVILVQTRVYYARTLSSIYDEVLESVSPVVLTASGQARVNPIYAPLVDIESNTQIEVTGSTNAVIYQGKRLCEPYICPGYVIGPFYYTSKLYPIEAYEYMTSGLDYVIVGYVLSPTVDELKSLRDFVLDGTLRMVLRDYTGWTGGDPDDVDFENEDWKSQISSESLQGIPRIITIDGTLRTLLRSYLNWPTGNPDDVDFENDDWKSQVSSESLQGVPRVITIDGTIRRELISYMYWPLGNPDDVDFENDDWKSQVSSESLSGTPRTFSISGTLGPP